MMGLAGTVARREVYEAVRRQDISVRVRTHLCHPHVCTLSLDMADAQDAVDVLYERVVGFIAA